jgi:ribosomal protein L24E
MSNAAAQAAKFYDQVTSEETVFGLAEDGGFLVFRIRDTDVVPFWSSKSRVTAIQKRNPKYGKWTLTEEPLTEFIERTLTWLEKDNISIGLNWSGERLVGYDVSVPELRKSLEYRIKRRNLANKLPLPTPASGIPAPGAPVAPPTGAGGR